MSHPILTDMARSKGDPRDMTGVQLNALRLHFNASLFDFAWTFFNFRDLAGSGFRPVHKELCDLLQLWGTPVTEASPEWHPGDRLMVQIPRGAYKSSLCTIANGLWQVSRNPNQTVLIANEIMDNAKKWLRLIREVISTNRLYQTVYRDVLPPGIHWEDKENGIGMPRGWKWSDQEFNLARDSLVPECSLTAAGVGTATTGGHWDRLIKDDLVSEDAKQSPTLMQRARDWFDSSLPLEKPPYHGKDLVVCTPWSYDDVYRYILEKYGYKLYRRQAIEVDDSGRERTLVPKTPDGKGWALEELREMQRKRPFYFSCTPADAPITMADFSQRPIASVQIGDKVVGFAKDESNWLRQVVTTVTGKGSKLATVNTYNLSDGTSIRCTPDHRWFYHTGQMLYSHLGDLGPRRIKKLRRVDSVQTPLTIYQEREAAWLGGFFDGEGTVPRGRKNGMSIGVIAFKQSEDRYPEVCARFRSACDALGFKYTELDTKTAGKTYKQFNILGGAIERARFLRICRPSKSAALLESCFVSRADIVGVDSFSVDGEEEVFALETETGNYVVYGMQSSNSQMMCAPKAGEEQSFQPQWLRYFDLKEFASEVHIPAEYYNAECTSLRTESGEASPAPDTVRVDWMSRILLVDPASADDKTVTRHGQARTGILVVGMDPWGRRFLLDGWAGKANPAEVINQMFTLAMRWNVNRVAIEEVTFSVVYQHWLRQESARRGYHLVPLPLKPAGRRKEDRILSLLPGFQRGLFYLRREGAPVIELFRREYLDYPYAATKDLLDALAYEADVLRRPDLPATARHLRDLDDEVHLKRKDITGYGSAYF